MKQGSFFSIWMYGDGNTENKQLQKSERNIFVNVERQCLTFLTNEAYSKEQEYKWKLVITKCNVACLHFCRSEEWNFIDEEEKTRLQHKIAEDGEFWWIICQKKPCFYRRYATVTKMGHTVGFKHAKTIALIPSCSPTSLVLQSFHSPTRVYWVPQPI